MKVWLDDLRPMPPRFDVHVKTAKEAINLLKTNKVEEISLDHDLGDIAECGTGYDVACYIEERAYYGNKPPKTNLHTANAVGEKAMDMAIKSAWKLWEEMKNHDESI